MVIPAKESGIHLADELSTPDLLNVLHLSHDYSLIEIQSLIGMPGKKVRDCEKYEVALLLILCGDEIFLSSDGEVQLVQGDILVEKSI